ncbi:hypothetical protein HT031_002760 [Scenedesmus sp. PABB004]|nr:hypothetical protein HT031_002760 [Scenedesmus sp. PABB004]
MPPPTPLAGLLLLALLALAAPAAASASGRRLLQGDQDSCPEGCSTDAGSCVPAATQGGFRCLKCDNNRVPARDGSCGCRPGFYLSGSSCTECGIGFYCPGGTATESAAAVGRISCNYNAAADPGSAETASTFGLTTRGTRSPFRTGCVNKPGFSYIKGTTANDPTAQPCPANTFSIGFRRQAACAPCPKGLKTDGTTLPKDRTSSAVCMVEPGRYWSLSTGATRCPKGEFRANWDVPGSSSDQCSKCVRGSTTVSPGKTSDVDCKVLLPGYQWTNVGGNIVPTQCAQKFYCPGGLATAEGSLPARADNNGRTACPNGMWTRGLGASADSECQVPPGHYLPSVGGTVTVCPSTTGAGTYQSEWLDRADPTALACTPCGSGISSAATEPLNEFALADSGNGVPTVKLVARSTAACYIEAGQGIVQTANSAAGGSPSYRAVNCNSNSFGVPNTAYGLDSKPCTSCPTGTSTGAGISPASTIAPAGYTSPEACVVPAGTGMSGGIALPCGKGTWNDGTTDPTDKCKACPVGTTTLAAAGTGNVNRDSADDCAYLDLGYAYTTAGNVIACPAGTFRSTDGATPLFTVAGGVRTWSTGNQTCTACPGGSTTLGGSTGATSDAECTVCPAGTGVIGTTIPAGTRPTGTAPSVCAACGGGSGASATFGSVWRSAGDYACAACPSASNVFTFFSGGTNNAFTPATVAPGGASDISQCLVAFAQVVDGNWNLATNVAANELAACSSNATDACHATLTGCVASCTGTCAFISYNYAGAGAARCYLYAHPTTACVARALRAGALTRVAYKIMPTSDASGRRRLRAASPMDQGSGLFSWWQAANGATVGVQQQNITRPNGQAGATFVASCLDTCTDSSDCAAVWFGDVSGTATTWAERVNSCSLRRGTFDVATTWRSLVSTILRTPSPTRAASAAMPPSTRLAGLLLLALLALAAPAAASASGRRLLQGDQDSCPDGCSTDAGSCVPAATQGGFRCLKCDNNRVPARDGSCGCRPGFYLSGSSCTECGIGFYCPGGTATESAAAVGRISCNYNAAADPGSAETASTFGLTTRGDRSASRTSCVNKPGFSYIKGTTANDPTAQPCPANTFSVGYRRQAACTPCPKGLKTDGTTLPKDRTSSAVCKVAPGRFWSPSTGAARCPKGEWQSNFVDPNAGAVLCTKCPRGVTTAAAGSTAATDCNVLLPTYYFMSNNSTSLCPQKSYCPGGAQTPAANAGKTACPRGMWTRSVGAKSLSDCMVPPGYSVSGSTSTPCAAGSFRPDWVRPASDATDIACQLCGDGITSDKLEPLAVVTADANGALTETVELVARTASSCYILPGYGVVQTASSSNAAPVFRAVLCGAGTYGVNATTYGLSAIPCSSCPGGTTSGANSPASAQANGGFTSLDACYATPGTGVSGGVALVCPQGTYNDGTIEPTERCKACPVGTTTLAAAGVNNTNRDSVADCSQLELGYGYYDPAGGAGTAYEVLPCPAVCPAGQGAANSGAACAPCASGTYGPDWRVAAELACVSCNGPANVYSFSYGGSLNVFNSTAVTPAGAALPSACVTGFAQVLDGKWYLNSTPDANLVSGPTSSPNTHASLEACVAACTDNCEYVSYNYAGTATTKCYLRTAANATEQRVAFKVMPGSGLARRAGAAPSDQGSGQFSWYKDSAGATAGTAMASFTSVSTPAFVSVSDCLNRCTDSTDCAAVHFGTVTGSDATWAAQACTLLQGTVNDMASPWRSLVRTRLDGERPASAAARPAWASRELEAVPCTSQDPGAPEMSARRAAGGPAPSRGGRGGARTATAALLALLALGLAGGAEARRQDEAASGVGRRLRQAALTCPEGCEPGGCVQDILSGLIICLDCSANRVPAVDGSCGCRAGRFLNDSRVCDDCPVGSYCPGGTAAASVQFSCNYDGEAGPPAPGQASTFGLTTLQPRAATRSQCVNRPGYFFVADATGVGLGNLTGSNHRAGLCPDNTYSPGLRRQAACQPCPGALKTDPADPPTNRTTSAVCKVEPGRYWARGAIRCPRAEYREGWAVTGAGPVRCTRCRAGSSTLAAGSKQQSDCSVVPPGHSLAGANGEVAECVNREGAGDASSPASWGTYQPTWLPPGDPLAASCRLCGVGVMSAKNEPLALFADTPTLIVREPSGVKLVARTSASCYIRAGQGLRQDGTGDGGQPVLRAVTCGAGSYGPPGDTFGLSALPCTPCPTGTATAAPAVAAGDPERTFFNTTTRGFTSPLACTTPAGWGFYGGEASPCPQGSYNDARGDEQNQCTACPDGTTTDAPTDAGGAASVDACRWVAPGYSYTLPPGGASVATIRGSLIEPCAIGTYADALRQITESTSQPCSPCPGGRTTGEQGARNATECDECPAGTGVQARGAACLPCPAGSFGSDDRPALGAGGVDVEVLGCRACPVSAVYSFPFNASFNFFASTAVSEVGASRQGQCLVAFAPVIDGNWRLSAGGDPGMSEAPGSPLASLEACVAACGAAAACQYLTYDYATRRCFLRAPPPGTSGALLAYKVVSPYATRASAAPRDYGTGVFSWWRDDAPGQVGVAMTAAEGAPGAFTSIAACLDACTVSSNCAAVRFGVAGGSVASCTLAKVCDAGQFLGESGECQACSKGSYCPGGAAAEAVPCPDGLTTLVLGATRAAQCGCLPGFYLYNGTGDAPADGLPCQLCPLGFFCRGGPAAKSVTTLCPDGLTTVLPGARRLSQCGCLPGSYLANATSPGGNGTDQEDDPPCDVCPTGSFCRGGPAAQSVATPCPDGLTTLAPGAVRPAQCGCLPGTYRSNDTAQCEDCPVGSICRGLLIPPATCNRADTTGLTTLTTGGASWDDCVNSPGYRYVVAVNSSRPGAGLCPKNSYNPGLEKQVDCTPCPTDLRTDARAARQPSSVDDCMVGPGWFVNGTAGPARCLRGQYRSGFVPPDSRDARRCEDCPRGTTTAGRAAKEFQECFALNPGFAWIDPSRQIDGSLVAQDGEAPSPAQLCPQDYYCPGGRVNGSGTLPCGDIVRGLWTRWPGGNSTLDCVVPPGHRLQLDEYDEPSVVPCANGDPATNTSGEYQPLWLAPDDPRAFSCLPCGDGVLSARNQPLDRFALADDGSGKPPALLATRSAASCYIRRGQGMLVSRSPNGTTPDIWWAVTCNNNTFSQFGANDSVSYDLDVEPCLPCPAGTLTPDLAVAAADPAAYFFEPGTGGFWSPEACRPRPGWGYSGTTAAPCDRGTYSWLGADGQQPARCVACPAGTTTPGRESASVAACSLVLPGFAYPNAASPLAGVAPCPLGRYADAERTIRANASDGACTTCPNGRTTADEGSTSAADCSACPAGTGAAAAGGPCAPCASGTFGGDDRAPGDLACSPCSSRGQVFTFSANGTTNPFTPRATSAPGSASAAACVAEFAPAGEGNWRLDAGTGLVLASAASLEACADACRSYPGDACQWATYDYAAGAAGSRCQLRVTGGSGGSTMLALKLVPSSPVALAMSAGGAVRPAAMGSGVFSWWRDDTAGGVGAVLSTLSQAGLTQKDCTGACADSATCAAVRLSYDGGSRALTSCTLVRGVTSTANTRRTLIRAKAAALLPATPFGEPAAARRGAALGVGAMAARRGALRSRVQSAALTAPPARPPLLTTLAPG